jgi:hypothetical protein
VFPSSPAVRAARPVESRETLRSVTDGQGRTLRTGRPPSDDEGLFLRESETTLYDGVPCIVTSFVAIIIAGGRGALRSQRHVRVGLGDHHDVTWARPPIRLGVT